MFKNYFKIAWRNLKANKLFTILNIAGLAIGMCVCLLLFAFISNELSFDRMYTNSDDIYRVNMKTSAEFNYDIWAQLPNAVGPAISKDIPQVKSVARLIKEDFGSTASLKVGDKNFNEDDLYLSDSTVFKMFDFKFIEGNREKAFSEPNAIVISQSAKKRLFGEKDPIGEPIVVNNRHSFHVTGVYKDLPKNSVLNCDMIRNIMDSWFGKTVYWSNASYETFALLQPEADVAKVQKQASALIDKYVKKDGQYFTQFIFQPLTKIHLYSSNIREGYTGPLGSISVIKSLLLLSILVLLIACVNYMNLSTANSRKRARGIGMNKILGADKKQMIALFYVETGTLVFISILIGYAGAFLALPLFQNIMGNEMMYSDLLAMPILINLCIIWILTTLIAGSYPALSMANISPLALVNKSKKKNLVADLVRKGLVVFQFAASIILIIAVVIIFQQMDFIRTKDLGYNPNGIVSVSVNSAKNNRKVQRVISDLKRQSTIKSVSAVQSIPGGGESGRSVRKLKTDVTGMPIKSCRTEGGVVKTLQLKLLAGKPLPENIAKGDSTQYTLINEKILNYLGYKSPKEAVGNYINTEIGDKSIITGVVKNFNYHSLKEDVGGYMYYKSNNAPEGIRTLLIRYNTTNLPEMMGQLKKAFAEYLPNTAFDYRFLDQHIDHLYASEQRTAKATLVFSLLAIFIACLGLFGLAAFTAEERTKEIGVRKVLGASVHGLVELLSKDFLKLVFVGFVIAAPLAYWIMHQWLHNFAYRIAIDWWVFVVAGLIAGLIALITVSFQAIKAAITNPVKSLRTE